MSALVEFLQANPTVSLFAIIALGSLLGQASVARLSLGPSGVLFVGMLFGHLGIQAPASVGSLGVVLFVYAIGLQAGPRFFKTFKRRGLTYAVLAVLALSTSFGVAVALDQLFHFGPALMAGVYSGALTSTPGLAAALEALKDPNVSVGYGVAYPFGVVGVVLFVQFMPRLLRIDVRAEAERIEEADRPPTIDHAWFEVRNPQLIGKSIEAISEAHFTRTELSRVTKNGRTLVAKGDVTLEIGDHVRAVGTDEELERLELVVGPRIEKFEEPPSQIEAMNLVVSNEDVAGKKLAELHLKERFGVVVARMWRDEFEFVPNRKTTLEVGDTLRVVGAPHDCQRFIQVVGHQEKKLQETNFLPLLVCVLAGVLIGLIPISLPGGFTIKLGLAGGPLFAGLIAGHYGRIGPLGFRIPLAAKYFIRELGLIFFLANAGTGAGADFWRVIRTEGVALFGSGVLMTLAPMIVTLAVAMWFFRLDFLTSMGVVCGAMTCTPGLGAVSKASDSEAPALGYAMAYPIALIVVTIFCQLLGLTLRAMSG